MYLEADGKEVEARIVGARLECTQLQQVAKRIKIVHKPFLIGKMGGFVQARTGCHAPRLHHVAAAPVDAAMCSTGPAGCGEEGVALAPSMNRPISKPPHPCMAGSRPHRIRADPLLRGPVPHVQHECMQATWQPRYSLRA